MTTVLASHFYVDKMIVHCQHLCCGDFAVAARMPMTSNRYVCVAFSRHFSGIMVFKRLFLRVYFSLPYIVRDTALVKVLINRGITDFLLITRSNIEIIFKQRGIWRMRSTQSVALLALGQYESTVKLPGITADIKYGRR